MYSSESPILDFYPQDFEQDRNGKKNDWEAVVKIPFMDQYRLRAAMKSGQSIALALDPTNESFISPVAFADIRGTETEHVGNIDIVHAH